MLLIGDGYQSSQRSQNPWRQDRISPVHRQCGRRTAKEEIEAFKANIIINIHQLTNIIPTVLWEINRDDFNIIDQLGYKVGQIMKQSLNTFTV